MPRKNMDKISFNEQSPKNHFNNNAQLGGFENGNVGTPWGTGAR
jgi:hypothetical protein